MMMKRNTILKSAAVLLALLMLSGCRNSSAWQDEERADDSESGKQEQTAENVIYLTSQKSVELASDEDKESWRAPLEALLAKMTPAHLNQGEYGDVLVESYAVSLLDVNLDGTPELIAALPGGSAGNVFYVALDLHTGEEVLTFGGGHDLAWMNYYDMENDAFRVVGKYRLQMGASYHMRYITMIEYDGERQKYFENNRFQVDYGVELEGVVGYSEQTVYYVNGEKVSAWEYFSAYDLFAENCLPIAGTGMPLYKWGDVCGDEASSEVRAKTMADAMLKSGQVFIKPAT